MEYGTTSIDESLSRQGVGIDTAGHWMSQGVILDKIAIVPWAILGMKVSDCGMVEIQHLLCQTGNEVDGFIVELYRQMLTDG